MSLDAADVVWVEQLLAYYGHVVDAKEWGRFDELFVDDAVLDYTGVNAPHVFHGVAEIRGYFEAVNHPSAHNVVNVVVGEIGDDVTVHSKFFVPFTRASHAPQGWYGGDYEDVVVRTPQGWRFSRRTCTERWRLAAGEGPFPPGRGTF